MNRTALTVFAVAAVLAACRPVDANTATPTTPVTTTETGAATDSSELAALTVRPEDTGAHYRREDWGDWTHHGNGCDTRELVLVEQAAGAVSGKGCKPLCPRTDGLPCWISHYDLVETTDPAALQVDHLVPVKEANRSGARDWTADQRAQFYNDRGNLRPVTVHANTSKGDRDPGTWRPSNRDYWCVYATNWVFIKTRYGLSVDPREHDALVSMFATCQ